MSRWCILLAVDAWCPDSKALEVSCLAPGSTQWARQVLSSVDHSCSDTESVPALRGRRHRVRLRWNSAMEQNDHCASTLIDPPDSHDQRFARVRHAMQQERRLDANQRQVRDAEDFIRSVVSRVGPLTSGEEIGVVGIEG